MAVLTTLKNSYRNMCVSAYGWGERHAYISKGLKWGSSLVMGAGSGYAASEYSAPAPYTSFGTIALISLGAALLSRMIVALISLPAKSAGLMDKAEKAKEAKQQLLWVVQEQGNQITTAVEHATRLQGAIIDGQDETDALNKTNRALTETCYSILGLIPENQRTIAQNLLKEAATPQKLFRAKIGLNRFDLNVLFEEIKYLDCGGCAVVCSAVDKSTGKKVAIKFPYYIDPKISESLQLRFIEREIAIAELLKENPHPGIVKSLLSGRTTEIINFGNVALPKATPFIVMEFLDGRNLDQQLPEIRNQHGTIISIVLQILEALTFLHAKGIINRDLKPNNVKINEEKIVKLYDFGLARDDASTASLTMQESAMGTLGYMSPEQASGKATDEKTDIFAVGAMLYEMITGNYPYGAKDNAYGPFITRIRSKDEAAALKQRINNLQIEPALKSIIQKALSYDPKERPSGTDLIEQLKNYQQNLNSPTILANAQKTRLGLGSILKGDK